MPQPDLVQPNKQIFLKNQHLVATGVLDGDKLYLLSYDFHKSKSLDLGVGVHT